MENTAVEKIIEALVPLVSAIVVTLATYITARLTAYLKAKTSKEDYDMIEKIIRQFVIEAEKVLPDGEARKRYVISQLERYYGDKLARLGISTALIGSLIDAIHSELEEELPVTFEEKKGVTGSEDLYMNERQCCGKEEH